MKKKKKTNSKVKSLSLESFYPGAPVPVKSNPLIPKQKNFKNEISLFPMCTYALRPPETRALSALKYSHYH